MAGSPSEWTVDTLREHIAAVMDERDRRYSVEAELRAEALRVKDEGDDRALVLARDIQTYKDERDNRLREQITEERGRYLTVDAYQQGHRELEKIVGTLGETVTALVTERAAAVRELGNRITLGLGAATIIITLVVAFANGVFS